LLLFQLSHGAAAAEHLGGQYELIEQLKLDYERTDISDKLKALFAIAGKVQKGGKHVTSEDVTRAVIRAPRTRKSMTRADCRCLLYVQPLRWTGSAHGNQLIPKCIARWERS